MTQNTEYAADKKYNAITHFGPYHFLLRGRHPRKATIAKQELASAQYMSSQLKVVIVESHIHQCFIISPARMAREYTLVTIDIGNVTYVMNLCHFRGVFSHIVYLMPDPPLNCQKYRSADKFPLVYQHTAFLMKSSVTPK